MKTWQTYEEVARYVLNMCREKFGLQEVHSKQKVPGLSGTNWEIDAKGVRIDDGAIFIVECRRHTTKKISQEALGGLAFRIHDTNATGGILVSPLGFQKGAQKVANSQNIIEVVLDENSTTESYIVKFLNELIIHPKAASCRCSTFGPEVVITESTEQTNPGDPKSLRD